MVLCFSQEVAHSRCRLVLATGFTEKQHQLLPVRLVIRLVAVLVTPATMRKDKASAVARPSPGKLSPSSSTTVLSISDRVPLCRAQLFSSRDCRASVDRLRNQKDCSETRVTFRRTALHTNASFGAFGRRGSAAGCFPRGLVQQVVLTSFSIPDNSSRATSRQGYF